MKTGASVDEAGSPYDYIVVIDAGSKGSRAHLYRAKQYRPPSKTERDEDDDSDDEEWKVEDIDKSKPQDLPQIELVRRKKVKPGIANFASNPKKLGSKYVGKLLNDMEKYIPQDQIARTPVFLHATGGMRLLKPEDQELILTEICSYIQKHSDFYLPDCASHVNSITGETEGLYSWIGLNYRYGVFDRSLEDKSTYGALDMGGVSTQMAFEPSNIKDEHVDYLFKVDLNFMSPQDESLFSYKIFSQSFLGGINQAHSRYDEKLIEKNTLVDPCLPKGYIMTVTSKTGEKVDIEGSSDFNECVKSLFDVLSEISVDKYCNLSDSQTTTSCLLSDSLPKMSFNEKQFVGINEFYSNLKEFLNYKDCYMRAQRICSLSYTDMLSETKLPSDEVEPEKTSEVCFKFAWIINVLHQGLDFPRYGIDPDVDDTQSYTPDFTVLDGFSWTLGRAVLYTFYETAWRLDNSSTPRIGYFEPSSQVFVPGGEALGVPMRPEYVVDYYNAKDHDNKEDDHDDDHDDDDHDDDWDDVSDHRLWGSLSFLLILFIMVYLLLGKTKRQSIVGAVYNMLPQQLKNQINYTPIEVEDDDLELGIQAEEEAEEERREDSFEIE